jgi:hypothetical protein
MKQIILIAIALMLVGGEVVARDSNGKFYTLEPIKCSQVLFAHAQLKVTGQGKSYIGSHDTLKFLGYIAGYITAVNMFRAGKVNHYPGTDIFEAANWTASWCRDNSNDYLHNAMAFMARSLSK